MTVQSNPDASRRKLQLWLGVGLFCVLFAGVDRGVEIDRRRHEGAEREYVAKYAELVALLGPFLSESPDRVRDEIAGGRPFQVLDPSPGVYGTRLWGSDIGPRYAGWSVLMRIKRGRLYGVQLIYPARVPYRGPSSNWLEMERARQCVFVLSAVAWGLGMVTLPFARRWRREIGQFCLAAVLVGAVAWCVDPARSWDRADWVAPKPIAVAALAALSAALALWPAPPADPTAGGRACGGCGYDLTGNESGICPECGRPTPRLLAHRWWEEAGRIEEVEIEPVDGADRAALDSFSNVSSVKTEG